MTEYKTDWEDRLVIAYHGTNRKTANIIQKQGFKEGTYFACHLEDAIGFGGEYVFGVQFPAIVHKIGWQFTCNEEIPTERIVRLRRYKVKTLIEYADRGEQVFLSSFPPGQERERMRLQGEVEHDKSLTDDQKMEKLEDLWAKFAEEDNADEKS